VRAGKSRKDIKPLVETAYGDNISQINRFIKAMKEVKSTFYQHHSASKKN
jgi:hypothetical protein